MCSKDNFVTEMTVTSIPTYSYMVATMSRYNVSVVTICFYHSAFHPQMIKTYQHFTIANQHSDGVLGDDIRSQNRKKALYGTFAYNYVHQHFSCCIVQPTVVCVQGLCALMET